MKKRGLSAVVTTLIIILLVLVAIGVVWVVISNLITEGSEEVSLGKFTINMEIKNVEVKNDGTIDVIVKRNPGEGELTGIKFLITDGFEVSEFEQTATIAELGENMFTLNYSGLVKDISIAPILKLDSGKQSIGNVIDEHGLNEEQKAESIKNMNGLVSFWRFENNLIDEKGINNGTINGSTYASGKYGNAGRFDGINDYIKVGYSTTLNLINHTILIWIKTTHTGNDQGILSKYDNHGYWNYQIYSDTNGKINYHIGLDITWEQSLQSNRAINDGAWHAVILKYDQTNMYVYIDGNLDNTVAETRTTGFGGSNLYIGTATYNDAVRLVYGQSDVPFNGLIDETIIFNRALSENEIKTLYNLYLS